MPVVTLTIAQIRTGLQSGFSLDPADQFTYSIPGAGSTWESTFGNYDGSNPQPTTTYSTLSVGQAANFVLAITAWDELIAPDFVSVADNGAGHGEVRAAFTSFAMGGSTAAYAFQGSNQTPTSIVGDVWINSTSTGSTFAYGTSDYQTLIHEMGHVLGLKHSFEPGGSTIPAPYENTRYTVMSYTDGSNLVTFHDAGGGSVGSNTQGVAVATPMVLDIAYAQDLYGAETTTRSGDTVYTFNQNDTFLQSIYDAGGNDTLDLSAITRPNVVDLNPGAYSSIAVYSRADQSAHWQGVFGAGFASFFNAQLAPANTYTWNDNLGIAFTTTIENVIGGSGNDTITGNGADNLFRLNTGGNDTAVGGSGNDGFYFGAALTAADSADGGAGTADQLAMQGNYAGLTLGATNLVNVEALALLPGNDTRFGDLAGNFYSYNLATVDANVGAGQLMTVNFNTLRASENVTFNGSAETNGSFLTYGGNGNDVLTGGQQSDGFFFGITRFGSSDSVNGQAGSDDQLGLQGLYSGGTAVSFGAAQLTGIETIALLSGGDARFGSGGQPYSYNLTMNDGNVGAGQTMTINANTLVAGEILTFNGSAETNGRFVIYSGGGGDTITGGAGNDSFYGKGGGDTLTGGLGNDTFFFLNTSDSTSAQSDALTDFSVGDLIDLAGIDAIASTGANDAFTFIGDAAFNHVAGEVRAFSFLGSFWQVQTDVDGDGAVDMQINLITSHSLTGADFVL